MRQRENLRPRVTVVGAGVSGCACGAALAAAGARVVLVNAALDSVCLPSYGPEVCAGSDAVERALEVFSRLTEPLGDAWVECSAVGKIGTWCVAVDRRRLSVEAKRALEEIGGLDFRQGLVVDTRPVRDDRRADSDWSVWAFEAETAFGEVLESDMLVLAPGLSMGGVVRIGGSAMPGGRYGESPAPGLREAVGRLGAVFAEAAASVGPGRVFRGGRPHWQEETGDEDAATKDERCSKVTGVASLARRKEPAARVWTEEALPLRVVKGGRATAGSGGPGTGERCRGRVWPSDYPAAPGWSGEIGRGWFGTDGGLDGEGGGQSADVWPDGVATSEIYAATREGEVLAGSASGGQESRLAQRIVGLRVANLDAKRRLRLKVEGCPMVWIAGRASGASDYLESLESGIAVAEDVIAASGLRSVGK